MREKLCVVLLIILIAPTTDVYGSETNPSKVPQNHQHKLKSDINRMKRSLHDENHTSVLTRTKRQSSRSHNFKYDNDEKSDDPFWGTRGRRESSEDNSIETDYIPPKLEKYCKFCRNVKYCKYCFSIMNKLTDDGDDSWERPGRNSFNEVDDDAEPFWGNRGRRQEQEEPFWGNRGRRQEDPPFWGNRGRREKSFSKFQDLKDDPFWGNRGRREENEPFLGNRGRSLPLKDPEDYEKDELGPFWGNRGRRKEDLKESIIAAMTNVENKIEELSRISKREGNIPKVSFWANRGRASQLKHLFNKHKPLMSKSSKYIKPYEPGTVLDDRIYAEEPHYILVERSSRSSAEEDPYIITRGKKRYLKTEIDEAARDRRGSIEEIFKSVRNDPYYIVRGKKDDDENNNFNTTTISSGQSLAKLKDLICSSIDLVTNDVSKVKRETSEENDRDRRNILRKLAAQLQIDPYFVSRGKKNGHDNTSSDFVEEFVNQVAEKCNN